jgi:hypothetical protein
MPKRRNLNGLPHNLTKSYFGTLRYDGGGYMADWLLKSAQPLNVREVTLDILTASIEPKQVEKPPLLYHLSELQKILRNELHKNGFQEDFIVEAKIRVEIPNSNIYSRTLYCYPILIDKEGRKYETRRIIETAYETFDPYKLASLSIWERLKRLFQGD